MHSFVNMKCCKASCSRSEVGVEGTGRAHCAEGVQYKRKAPSPLRRSCHASVHSSSILLSSASSLKALSPNTVHSLAAPCERMKSARCGACTISKACNASRHGIEASGKNSSAFRSTCTSSRLLLMYWLRLAPSTGLGTTRTDNPLKATFLFSVG